MAKAQARSGSPANPERVRNILKVTGENTAESEAALAELLKRRPDIAKLAAQVTANPKDMESIQALAEAYFEEKLFLQSHDLFRHLAFLAPENSKASLGLARIYEVWGENELALLNATRAAELDPASLDALLTLAGIQLRRREIDAALATCLNALSSQRDNTKAHAFAGYVYMLKGDWENARRQLQRALEIDGTIAETRNKLGIVLARLGDREGALGEFTLAGDIATAHNNLGVVDLSVQNWRVARAEFGRALAIRPDYALAAVNLQEAESHLRPTAEYASQPMPDSSAGTPSDSDKGIPDRGDRGNEAERPIHETLPAAESSYQQEMSRLSMNDPVQARMASTRAVEADPGPEKAGERLKEVERRAIRSAYSIQILAEKNEDAARTQVAMLTQKAGLDPIIVRVDLGERGIWYRVQLCMYKSFAEAAKAAKKLKAAGWIQEYWIVPPESHAPAKAAG